MAETLVSFGSGIKLCIQTKTAASNVGWLLFSLHSSIKIKSRERQPRTFKNYIIQVTRSYLLALSISTAPCDGISFNSFQNDVKISFNWLTDSEFYMSGVMVCFR